MVTHHFSNAFSFCGHNSTYIQNLSSPLSSHMNTYVYLFVETVKLSAIQHGLKIPIQKKNQSSTLVVWFIYHSLENSTEHRAVHALLLQNRVFFSSFVIKESLSQNWWGLFRCHCSWQLKRISTASLGMPALHSEENTASANTPRPAGRKKPWRHRFLASHCPKTTSYNCGNSKPSCLRRTGWKRSPVSSNPAKEAMSA